MYDPALHHIHLRKRFANNFEQYPHPNKIKRLVDRLIYVAGVLGPLISLPQIIEIWYRHNAAGISILSWTGYSFLSIIWLAYGIIHKEKPIIYSHVIWLCSNILVTIGAILYG